MFQCKAKPTSTNDQPTSWETREIEFHCQERRTKSLNDVIKTSRMEFCFHWKRVLRPESQRLRQYDVTIASALSRKQGNRREILSFHRKPRNSLRKSIRFLYQNLTSLSQLIEITDYLALTRKGWNVREREKGGCQLPPTYLLILSNV